LIKNRIKFFSRHIFASSNSNNAFGAIFKINNTNNKKQTSMRNKVQLIGNLGNAPEVKMLESGKKLVKLSMATNETYKNAKGERVTETQWHNLVAWGKTADIIEKYLKKGSEVAIEGKLMNKNYTDKDGIKRYYTEILVNELLMLDGKEK
jgi:single-strand DNA-binding protein